MDAASSTETVQITWLEETRASDPAVVGGKAAYLSQLATEFAVPAGFCLTGVRLGQEYEDGYAASLASAYEELTRRCGRIDPPVAVRSSAADEDGAGASFAGQHETVLGVTGQEAVAAAVRDCVASFSSARALAYRRRHGLSMTPSRWAVLVQRLIPADAAGVAFSLDPVSGNCGVVVIDANLGLGESVVAGTVTPDSYLVRSEGLAIVDRRFGDKRVMTVPVSGGVHEVALPRVLRSVPALDDDQIRATAQLTLDLERRMGWPVDVEFAWSKGRLYLLQCRPVTTSTTGERPTT
jgi:pyruvate,water dikinase